MLVEDHLDLVGLTLAEKFHSLRHFSIECRRRVGDAIKAAFAEAAPHDSRGPRPAGPLAGFKGRTMIDLSNEERSKVVSFEGALAEIAMKRSAGEQIEEILDDPARTAEVVDLPRRLESLKRRAAELEQKLARRAVEMKLAERAGAPTGRANNTTREGERRCSVLERAKANAKALAEAGRPKKKEI